MRKIAFFTVAKLGLRHSILKKTDVHHKYSKLLIYTNISFCKMYNTLIIILINGQTVTFRQNNDAETRIGIRPKSEKSLYKFVLFEGFRQVENKGNFLWKGQRNILGKIKLQP